MSYVEEHPQTHLRRQVQALQLCWEIGLDKASFQTCLDSGRFAGRVKEDYEDGRRAGVTGTPGNILRNQSGDAVAAHDAQSYDRLVQALESLLGR